jgi:hypothetical protein
MSMGNSSLTISLSIMPKQLVYVPYIYEEEQPLFPYTAFVYQLL